MGCFEATSYGRLTINTKHHHIRSTPDISRSWEIKMPTKTFIHDKLCVYICCCIIGRKLRNPSILNIYPRWMFFSYVRQSVAKRFQIRQNICLSRQIYVKIRDLRFLACGVVSQNAIITMRNSFRGKTSIYVTDMWHYHCTQFITSQVMPYSSHYDYHKLIMNYPSPFVSNTM